MNDRSRDVPPPPSPGELVEQVAAGVVSLVKWGARSGLGVASWTERQALSLLQSRLDAHGMPVSAARVDHAGLPAEHARPHNLTSSMQDLLGRALEQGTSSSRDEVLTRVVGQLVPDEARIISALSDGSRATCLDVFSRKCNGSPGQVELENMSLVGRTANLALPELVPTYVAHLIALGLLERGPVDDGLTMEYEVLAAEPAVLAALKRGARGPVSARVERGTIMLTPLGLDLCAATGLSAT